MSTVTERAVPVVGDHLARLVAQLCPAWVYGERWDSLAWNRAAGVIHGDLAELHGIEGNGMYQFFRGDRMRRMLVDWEHHARGLVGTLRHARARYIDDAWFDQLLAMLLEQSPEFSALWPDHQVRPFQDGRKEFEHPVAGRLSFDFTILRVADERLPVMNLVTYIPVASTPTRVRIEEMLAVNDGRA